MVPHVYGSAVSTPGYLEHSKRDPETLKHNWGDLVAPNCWGGEVSNSHAATLSMWEDLESVAAFAYHGLHGEAMKRRQEWFVRRGLPEHVAWWQDDSDPISFGIAAQKMDLLHDLGPTPDAFSLRCPFVRNGRPVKINAEMVRTKAAQHAGLSASRLE